MSDVSVDIIKNRSGEAPDLPSGANLSGVSTAATLQVTNLNPTHINASGVTTATTFSGSLKTTGTPTLGLGVTINSSGINISGVATAGIVSATTLYGDGSNLTGVAMSIAPISYQPDVNDTLTNRFSIGIGITFTERVIAGSGNVTLRIAGAGGTVVENFGVGSSVTISNNKISITPTADLAADTVYHLSYPSGAFTNTAGDVSYVGTAYTFTSQGILYHLFGWGGNGYGLSQQPFVNNQSRSSPTQITGNTWSPNSGGGGQVAEFGTGAGFIRTDGTLWSWGSNSYGDLGQNESTQTYSSPKQVGSDTTWATFAGGRVTSIATKTNGTLWMWGNNSSGELGQNNRTAYSSPVQIPGTTWATGVESFGSGQANVGAIKTDGTLWIWGANSQGRLGLNDTNARSSPVQIPGTTWSKLGFGRLNVSAIKTDGTLWSWGYGDNGELGVNNRTRYSSPVQCPGTTWSRVKARCGTIALKTNGTLWAWGGNDGGHLGQNSQVKYSSPVQIPGTTWSDIGQTGRSDDGVNAAIKTDGTLWTWGGNREGSNGINVGGDAGKRSSPTQVPGTTWYKIIQGGNENLYAFKQI